MSFARKGNAHENSYSCRSIAGWNNGFRDGPDRHFTRYFKWCVEHRPMLGYRHQSGSTQIRRIQWFRIEHGPGFQHRLVQFWDRGHFGLGFTGKRVRQRSASRNAELLISCPADVGLDGTPRTARYFCIPWKVARACHQLADSQGVHQVIHRRST